MDSSKPSSPSASQPSFLVRHSFLIRRLHSLSGLVPVGAYMVVHLLVNASVLNGPATFLNNVLNIHKLGAALPFVEWTFIFIPILFHAIVGVVIVAGGLPNTNHYPLAANYRYTLQRATGMIAFVFIALHVFHMHGWFHQDSWVAYVVNPLGGGQFKPYNATSTAGLALTQRWGLLPGAAIAGLYLLGILSCVYHLANGIWTAGITWGVWTSPPAQRRALTVCTALGVLLFAVGCGALFGLRSAVDTPEKLQALQEEEARIVKLKIEEGEILENEHKVARPPKSADQASRAPAN